VPARWRIARAIAVWCAHVAAGEEVGAGPTVSHRHHTHDVTLHRLDEPAIAKQARRVAGALRALRLQAGDRLPVLAGNTPDFVVLRDAATILDLVFVPLNPRLAAREVRELVRKADARLLVADREDRPIPEDVEVWFSEDLLRVGEGQTPGKARDPQAIGATILFTSGTTGSPKACLRLAAAETARSDELRATYALGPKDVHLIVCPLAHSAPGIFLRACRAAGARTVLAERFDPVQFLDAVRLERATVFFLVPTQVERLLALPPETRERADWSSVRACIVAGAPFSPSARHRFNAWLGPGKLWEFYGSSETGSITVLPPDEQADAPPGCVGRPPAGCEVQLRDPERGAPVAAGEVGEVFVRSPALMSGYLGEPPVPAGAFVSVGDLGRLDAAGRLLLVDRKHDLVISGGVNVYPAEVERDTIISGGLNVYPAEVERALAEHPDVIGAVVCGVPDPDWGERVVALVAARSGEALPEDTLRSFLKDRLAAYKIPKSFKFVTADQLPIGPSGKPLRRVARGQFTG
jgi:long-chain acyl-CoA synthetase